MATITFNIPNADMTRLGTLCTQGDWADEFAASGLTAKQFVQNKLRDVFFTILGEKLRGENVRSKQAEATTAIVTATNELTVLSGNITFS